MVILLSINGNMKAQQDETLVSNFKKHLFFLGSDIFEGRGTGTLGGYLASKYLAYRFDEYKLLPMGDDVTYYQNIPFHSSKPLESSEFTVYVNDTSISLSLWDDYVPVKTGEQTYISGHEKLVFVGYGINAPEYDYNDYQYSDVENKIVVILEGEPHSDNPEFFDGDFPTIYSYLEAKERIAISRGAKGCIFIPDRNNPQYDWAKIRNQYSFDDITLAYNLTGNFSVIINPLKAGKLFVNSPLIYEDVERMEKFGALKSFPLSSSISFKGSFKEREFFSPNIIGMIPGSDPKLKNTYLIITAHYDHLGIGPAINGDSIYNGVFDNAMGVSALLEIARQFAELPKSPERSIIFMLTTAEEKGLLGSYYYVTNPLVSLYKTVANINIDGIASFDEFKSIIAVGAEYSSLEQTCAEIAESEGLKISVIPKEFKSNEAFNLSDQFTFAKAGIPSVLIMDAPDYVNLSREEGINRFIAYDLFVYHTPFDDFNLPVNYDAVKQHIDFLYKLILNIANSEEEPEWKSGSPFINERLRTRAEKR
jgi:Zn-dependent M28 family amino/carboxypeptidase